MNLNDTPATPAIGAQIEGGYFAGVIRIGAENYGIVVAPAGEGTLKGPWHAAEAAVDGACSCVDGLANTEAMAAAGSELASAARALAIAGFTDWYIPSRDELELCYRNLKPLAYENAATFRDGDNPSSIPAGYPYTEGLPAQTGVPEFQEGGAQAFADELHWSSSQYAPGSRYAWSQDFSHGNQLNNVKGYAGRARAVRRFKI
jgi:hypothetical protein